jgi:hypothetical protein
VILNDIPEILIAVRGISNDVPGILIDAHGILTGVHGILNGARGILNGVRGILNGVRGILNGVHGTLTDVRVISTDVRDDPTYDPGNRGPETCVPETSCRATYFDLVICGSATWSVFRTIYHHKI